MKNTKTEITPEMEHIVIGESKVEYNVGIGLEPTLRQRKNGKALCTRLKKARKALADANGIHYEIEKCPNEGPCAGTCEKCDVEAEYLLDELEKIPEEKRIFPKLNINPFRYSRECRSSVFYDPYVLEGCPAAPIHPYGL